MRCGPGGTSGIDNVPESLAVRYQWFLPWRYFGIGKKGDGEGGSGEGKNAA
jgi:hypothetical protein